MKKIVVNTQDKSQALVDLTAAELSELQANIEKGRLEQIELDKLMYQSLRAAEYPSSQEVTVALWEKVMENRPESANALQEKRQAIKAKYPKP